MRPIDTSLERAFSFENDPALRRRFKIIDKNIPGNIRWGKLLESLDKMAEDVALDYVRKVDKNARVVTAAIDDMALHTPANINKDVYMRARINYVGRTSMEVGIRVDQDTKAEKSSAACYLTTVARTGIGDAAQSLPLPQLEYESDVEKERYNAAIARRKLYKEQLTAIGEPPTQEEFHHLQQLHQAQEQDDFHDLLASI